MSSIYDLSEYQQDFLSQPTTIIRSDFSYHLGEKIHNLENQVKSLKEENQRLKEEIQRFQDRNKETRYEFK
jgi:molecular chaperone GrpE (heat shock protein)